MRFFNSWLASSSWFGGSAFQKYWESSSVQTSVAIITIQFTASQCLWKLQIKDNLLLHSWSSRNWLHRWLSSSEQYETLMNLFCWKKVKAGSYIYTGHPWSRNLWEYHKLPRDRVGLACICFFSTAPLSHKTSYYLSWFGNTLYAFSMSIFCELSFVEVQINFLLNPFEYETFYILQMSFFFLPCTTTNFKFGAFSGGVLTFYKIISARFFLH